MVTSKGVRLRMLAYLRLKIPSYSAVLVITLGSTSTIVEIHAECGCAEGLEPPLTPFVREAAGAPGSRIYSSISSL